MTFEETGGKTLLVLHELYPSKEALDGAIASGSTDGMGETLEQLDELVVTLGASISRLSVPPWLRRHRGGLY